MVCLITLQLSCSEMCITLTLITDSSAVARGCVNSGHSKWLQLSSKLVPFWKLKKYCREPRSHKPGHCRFFFFFFFFFCETLKLCGQLLWCRSPQYRSRVISQVHNLQLEYFICCFVCHTSRNTASEMIYICMYILVHDFNLWILFVRMLTLYNNIC